MQVGHGFEQMLYQLVAYLIVGAVVFLFIQLLIYSTITIKKFRRSGALKRLLPTWSRYIDSYLRTGRKAGIVALDRDERTNFRDLLISYYCGSPQDPSKPEIRIERDLTESEKRRLRILYREIGFLAEDLHSIEEGLGYEKAVALGRLARLELNDAEDLAMDLLDERDRDLVLSCVSYLTSIRSRFLSDRLGELVANSTDNEFKELMLELLKSDLEMGAIKDLSCSGNPRCRMAAAILVGRSGLRAGVNVLKPMAKDRSPQVRAEAARSLSRVGTPQALKLLESMAWDMDSDVGTAVEESMDEIPEKRHHSSVWDRPVHMPASSEFQKGGLNDVWSSDRIIG